MSWGWNFQDPRICCIPSRGHSGDQQVSRMRRFFWGKMSYPEDSFEGFFSIKKLDRYWGATIPRATCEDLWRCPVFAQKSYDQLTSRSLLGYAMGPLTSSFQIPAETPIQTSLGFTSVWGNRGGHQKPTEILLRFTHINVFAESSLVLATTPYAVALKQSTCQESVTVGSRKKTKKVRSQWGQPETSALKPSENEFIWYV